MSQTVVSTGCLKTPDGHEESYEVRHGICLKTALECDHQWLGFTLGIIQFAESQSASVEEQANMLEGMQKESAHWSWYRKSAVLNSSEHIWFYLYAEGRPQAVCILYHPKDSLLGNGKIFYIEYLAVAPWNRTCALHTRCYLGVGTELIKVSLRFAIDQLGLTPGCSLHSLPQAMGYYQKLKMIHIAGQEKDGLPFFELPNEEAKKLIHAA